MTIKHISGYDESIRVLQIVGQMNNAGVETVVMNYYRNIDRSKIQYDFIIGSDSKYAPIEEIEALGGKVYIVAPYKKILTYLNEVYRIIKKNNYKIVHSHLNTLSVFPLFAAFLAGSKVRIAHNHSTAVKSEPKTKLKKILKPFAKIFPTHYCACSEYAARWLFGDSCYENGNVTIINNAIDFSKYEFNENVRIETRRELDIDGKLVFGHIGRFQYQKNHDFLIDIFEQIHLKDNNTVLLLAGDGDLKDDVLRKISSLNLNNAVKFLGPVEDTNPVYQAMDAFILPSLYEGFGMVGIEAQVAGIKFFCSTAVPQEVKATDLVEFISLDKSAAYWAERILRSTKKEDERPNCSEQVRKSGFDIKIEAGKLLEYYKKIT